MIQITALFANFSWKILENKLKQQLDLPIMMKQMKMYSKYIFQFWMVLDIKIGEAIGKFFKGTREDVERVLSHQSQSNLHDGH